MELNEDAHPQPREEDRQTAREIFSITLHKSLHNMKPSLRTSGESKPLTLSLPLLQPDSDEMRWFTIPVSRHEMMLTELIKKYVNTRLVDGNMLCCGKCLVVAVFTSLIYLCYL